MSQTLENQQENQLKIEKEVQKIIKEITQKAIEILKTILDPEVRINIWDFGLIYGVNIKQIAKNKKLPNLEKNQENQKNELNNLKGKLKDEFEPNLESKLNCPNINYAESFICEIVMTFTSVNCPAIELLPREITTKIYQILGIQTKIEIVWSPKWEISLLSEEIQFELGML